MQCASYFTMVVVVVVSLPHDSGAFFAGHSTCDVEHSTRLHVALELVSLLSVGIGGVCWAERIFIGDKALVSTQAIFID